MPKKRIPWVKYFFQFALPAFLVSAKTAAQGQVKIDTGDTIITPKQAIRHFEEVKETGPGKQITGKVTDVNGGGIPYASVFIKGTTIGVATDSIGNFTLKYPGNENRLVLISSSVGYRITESVVDLNEMGQIFTIYMDYNTLEEFVVSTRDLYKMGGFVGGLVVKKISIVDTILSKVFITGPTLKLYPNPIKKNASLTIESDKAKEGSYFVQVIALNGQIVYNKEIRIEMNDRFIKVDIPPVACGTYLVSVVNKQSGKARTEKLVIE